MPRDDFVPPECSFAAFDGRPWVGQGDIYRDVECIESVDYDIGTGTVSESKLMFPLAVVLGQECDLLSDAAMRLPDTPPGRSHPATSGQALLSVLMTPLYNSELFFEGQHCSGVVESLFLGSTSTLPSSTPVGGSSSNSGERLSIRKGLNERYQFLHFGVDTPLVDCVIDFKHYFSVSSKYLLCSRSQCVGQIGSIFSEAISQRFGFYLARIALPDGTQPVAVSCPAT